MSSQIYNQAMALKQEIDKHNADVKNLLSLHQKLALPTGQNFNYNNSRLLSDQLNLQNLQNIKNIELQSLQQRTATSSQLDSYLKDIQGENMNYLNKLNETILDKNQIININQRHYEKTSLYSTLLVSLLGVTVWILILSAFFSFNAITRSTFVILLVLSLIGYLIYAFYILIKVRYFRDPNFSVYRHTIDPNIGVHQCQPCNGDGNGITGSDSSDSGNGNGLTCPGALESI